VGKKRSVRLTTHQGFVSNREGAKGSPEPTNRRRIPTVALFTAMGNNWKMRWSQWVLMGKEWLRGTEEDTRPDPAHRRGG
jgi:hypothetical protein